MNKNEVVLMMVESFSKDNMQLALQSGMPESEINDRFEKSKNSVEYMLSNIYDLLESNNLLKSS